MTNPRLAILGLQKETSHGTAVIPPRYKVPLWQRFKLWLFHILP